jgi:hypothetical protein
MNLFKGTGKLTPVELPSMQICNLALSKTKIREKKVHLEPYSLALS